MSSILTGLVSYYKMEGNGNDSLGVNNATTTSNIIFNSSWGKILQGGTGLWPGSVLDTSALVGFPSNANPRTECVWFKSTSSQIMVLMPYGTDIGGGPPNQDFAILCFGGNLGVGLGAGGSSSFFTGHIINDGLWHFIVFTYDGITIKVYCDNVLVGSQNVLLDTIPTTLRFWAYQFDGSLDEVGFWSRVLTPTELTDLYNSGNGLTYPFLPPVSASNAGLLFNLL